MLYPNMKVSYLYIMKKQTNRRNDVIQICDLKQIEEHQHYK